MPREALAHPEGIVVRRLAAALTCLCVALLSACSAPEPSPAPATEASVGSAADTSEATATSTPDDVVQTTSSGAGKDPGVPELPAEAMEDTEDGAEAFVQYYVDLLNYAAQFPRKGQLSKYGAADCKTCDAYEAAQEDRLTAGTRYAGPFVQASSLQAISASGKHRVSVIATSPSVNILNDQGDVLDSLDEGKDVEAVFQVDMTSSGFTIEWIKFVETN